MHAGGLPSSFAGFCSGFLRLIELPRVSLVIVCNFFDEVFVADPSRLFNENASKKHLWGGPEAPKTVPERF